MRRAKMKGVVPSLLLSSLFSVSVKAKSFENSTKLEAVESRSELELEAGLSHYNFLHNQDYSDSFATLDLNWKSKKTKFKGFAWFSSENSRLETYSVPEAYYKEQLWGLNIYTGRRVLEWSKSELYKPTGFWNNSWDFNKTNPKLEGLIGVFLEKEWGRMSHFNFFASPISVPKFVTHLEIKNQGDVTSQTPWSTLPPEQIQYGGQNLPLNYNMDRLDYMGLASNMQLGGSLHLENDRAFFKMSYLYGGAKDVDLGLDFVLDSSTSTTPVEISVTPNTYRLHRYGLDLGYKWTRLSETGLSWNHREREEGLTENTRESYVGVGSGSLFQIYHSQMLTRNTQIKAFYNENTQIQNEANGELGDLLKDYLAVPFRFVRGWGVELNTRLWESSRLSLFTYYDTELEGVLSKTHFKQFIGSGLAVDIGVELVEPLNEMSSGFYKDFRRNDFVYGNLTYVY